MGTVALIVGGLVLLVLGAEGLVRGASRLGAMAGLSPLVIGLTIVAYGTSAPELAVSVQAGLDGQADIAVANVVGSNLFNVLLILGLCAAVTPLVVAQQLVRVDVPIMIAASGLVLVFAMDESIGRREGLVLALGLVAYTVFGIRKSRRESAAVVAEYAQEYGPVPRDVRKAVGSSALAIVGLGTLVLGARWLVTGAIEASRALGVAEEIIGLTVVAAGTSLPELATSVVATLRGERDIAIGNVIGSNIYNLLAILGVAALVTPGGLGVAPSMLSFDLPLMVVVAVACLPVFVTGARIDRWEGSAFLLAYGVYTTYLVLRAVEHPSLPGLRAAALWMGIPIVAVTAIVVTWRMLRGPGREREGAHPRER